MIIENLGEFASFCQENADDPDLPDAVAFAEELATSTEDLMTGFHYDFDRSIDMTFDYHKEHRGSEAGDMLLKAEPVLSRFWEHRGPFAVWFKSKVIVSSPAS